MTKFKIGDNVYVAIENRYGRIQKDACKFANIVWWPVQHPDDARIWWYMESQLTRPIKGV